VGCAWPPPTRPGRPLENGGPWAAEAEAERGRRPAPCVTAVRAAAKRLVEQRFLLEGDAAWLVREAEASAIFRGGGKQRQWQWDRQQDVAGARLDTHQFGERRRPVTLSAKAVQRLARLGYATDADLQFWQGLCQSEGESFFWGFLRKEEEAADEYLRWFPRLQAFAAECRLSAPVPAVNGFSAAEREQHRVLLANMREFAGSADRRCVLARKPHLAAILSTTRVGLVAAEEVFGGSGAVILEESERERWLSEVYPVNHEAFWWYSFAWWTLREGLTGEDEASIRQHCPIPERCAYWVVTSGVQWGGLAGGANHELWRWDGERAELIELYCIDTY
jgi:hypothetical protein